MKSLYHEIIMDHYRKPRCWGMLTGATVQAGLDNPSCGDSVAWQALIEQDKVIQVAFEGKGCVISLATASLLAEWVGQKSCGEVMLADAQLVQGLLGTTLGITRLKCALLPLEALHKAITLYVEQNAPKKENDHAGSSQISTGACLPE